MKKHKYIYRFVLVGITGFVFNSLVLLVVMREFGANRLIGEAVAMLFSLQLTFALHDRWTYKGEDFAAGYSMGVRKRYVSYLISNSFGSVLTVVLFASFAFLPRFMALGAAAAVSMVWNFVFNKVVIWRKSNAVALSQAE